MQIEELQSLIIKSKENHVCPVCGKECGFHSRSTKKNPRWNLFCSNECKYSPVGKQMTAYIQKESIKENHPNYEEYMRLICEKRKQTNLEKYGVEHPLQSKKIQEKYKQTCLEKYGAENPFQKEEFKNKYRKTMEELYGEAVPIKNNSIKERIKQTCLERYGVENISQLSSTKEKVKQTNKNKYGIDCFFRSPVFRANCYKKYRVGHWESFVSQLKQKNITPLFEREDYIEQTEKSHNFFCESCQKSFYVEERNTYAQKIFCPEEIHKMTSKMEYEIYDWLVSIGIPNIERNKRNWNLDKNYEADIYIPEYKLVIEFDGLYWHSNLYKDKNYHLNKWKFFKELGIDCIQIFENEWYNKQDIVKSIIKNQLGLNEKIYARKCIVKEIPNNEYELFLEQNHIQGYCGAKVRLGLYYNNELIEVMSFSKSRFNKKYDWENIRTCTKIGYSVVGGFSKLLSYFKKNYKGNIVSYVDSRYFNGKGYLKNGFQNISHSNPNYYYFKTQENILYNRIEFQKHKLKDKLEAFNESSTEQENMSMNNYLWIYDCGNDIMVYGVEDR